MKAGNPEVCKELLKPIAVELPEFGRHLLLEASRTTNDFVLLIELLSPPKSISELIELTEICIRKRDYVKAILALDQYAMNLGITDSHLRELRSKISAAEAMVP